MKAGIRSSLRGWRNQFVGKDTAQVRSQQWNLISVAQLLAVALRVELNAFVTRVVVSCSGGWRRLPKQQVNYSQLHAATAASGYICFRHSIPERMRHNQLMRPSPKSAPSTACSASTATTVTQLKPTKVAVSAELKPVLKKARIARETEGARSHHSTLAELWASSKRRGTGYQQD